MIDYRCNQPLTLDEFIGIYERSALAERRPASNRAVMQQMLDNADLTITAWVNDKLIGIARTLTDFAYAAYLSDLAVDKAWHKQGIGRELIRQTQARLGDQCKIILLAAPAANDYYPSIGFEHNPRAWMLDNGKKI